MGTEPLPPGVYPIAVDKYIISYHIIHSPSQLLYFPTSSEINRHQHTLRSVTLKNTSKKTFEERQNSCPGNPVLECASGYRYPEATRNLNYPFSTHLLQWFSLVHVFHCCTNINLTRKTPRTTRPASNNPSKLVKGTIL
jgi:hypothetical protein